MARRRPSVARPAAAPTRSAASASASRARPSAWAGLALCLLTVVAYAPAFRADFIWDDDDYVTDNATLDDAAGLARIWLEPGAVPQYYPLTFTSLWLEHQIYGDRATGYHVTNVLLHALNAVLAWRILATLGVSGAWLAAAIFAVHPVHVESVAWITERKNVLSGAGYLAALLAALAFADPSASAAARRRYGLAVLGCFVAALLAKTVTCTLPAILLLLVWWRRGRLSGRDVRATVPLFALGLGLAFVTIWLERTHVGARGVHWDLTLWQRVLIAGRAVWFYAASLVWPFPLSFVYPRWTVDAGSLWQWTFPIAAVALALAVWSVRTRLGRWPIVAIVGFVVTLAPALGFVDVYPMRYTFVADHYQYLASLFLIAPAAALLAHGARRLGIDRPAVAAAPVVALLVLLTWRHAASFADQETLWRDVIAHDPSSSMAHVNLGMWLQQHGRAREAAAALETALRLEPDDAEVHGDLGIVLASLGRSSEARAHLERAVALAPESAQARSNLGNVLAGAGDLDGAVAQYREAVRLDPRYADAQNNLANVLVQQGRTDEAIERYEAALAADPGYVAAHANLATVLARVGRDDEAIAHYRTAVRLDPTLADAERALGARLAARGAWGEAITHLAAAARLRPDEAEVHYQLGAALAGAGRIDEAIVAYARALELRPDAPDLHNDLGIAFARRGDLDAAAAEFRKALALAPDHAEARSNLAALDARRPAASP
jgi:tetratricopeptide (TPR) repeat protein